MNSTFGEYIRQLRNSKGLTLTQLGAKLNLDSANLSKIENGIREFDEKRLSKLSKVFKLDIEELKTEYFSDAFAKKLYRNNCSNTVFQVAEEKLNYLKSTEIVKG